MTRPRQLLLSAFLVALAAPGVYAQDAVDQLAEMIAATANSPDPATEAITGFQRMGDFEADAAQIQEAIRRANVSGNENTAVFEAATSIRKSGSDVSMRRSRVTEVAIDSGGAIQYGKSVSFALTNGFVGTLGGDAMERMKDARGDYLRLSDVEGVKVRKEGGGFYTLYEMYRVTEEDGTPVAHVKAGNWIAKQWVRVPLGAPTPVATAVAAPVATTVEDTVDRSVDRSVDTLVSEAPAVEELVEIPNVRDEEIPDAEENGLPALATPASLTSIDESTPMIRETVPAVREREELEDVVVYEAPIVPVEETPIVPEDATTQKLEQTSNGLLERLETATGETPETTQIMAPSDDDDGLLTADRDDDDTTTPSDVARSQTVQTADAGDVTDALSDKPLTDVAIETPEELTKTQSAQADESAVALNDKPLEDRLEALEAREGAEFDASAAAKDDDVLDAEEGIKGESIPVVIPEEGEKARIDEGVDEAKTLMDEEGDRLTQLMELIKTDREAAEERMEARIAELNEKNAQLEERIVALTERLGQQGNGASGSYSTEDALADLAARHRRNNATPIRRDTGRDRYPVVNGPRSYDDYRGGRMDRRGDDRYDRYPTNDGRYDRYPTNDGRYDRYPTNDGRYDRYPTNDGRYDRYPTNRDGRYNAPINGRTNGPVGYDRNGRPIYDQDDNSHMSGLQRLFLKLLDGVQRGIQNRYANQTARNLQLNSMALAGANANNRGYVDNRMRNAMINSNLGRTAGINTYGNSPNFLYATPETTAITPYNGNVYAQPNAGTTGLYYSAPTNPNMAPLNSAGINIPLGGATPIIRR